MRKMLFFKGNCLQYGVRFKKTILFKRLFKRKIKNGAFFFSICKIRKLTMKYVRTIYFTFIFFVY